MLKTKNVEAVEYVTQLCRGCGKHQVRIYRIGRDWIGVCECGCTLRISESAVKNRGGWVDKELAPYFETGE